ncbi:potassium transporter TrkG [Pelagibacterium lacus]|nr:potassium transporter TrkG [Pelagibacterium lacus]
MPTIAILAAGMWGVVAIAMVLPLMTALIEGNWRAAEAMTLIAIGQGFVAGLTLLALGGRRRRLTRAGVFTAAIAIWLSLVIAAAPAFMLIEGQAPIPALFEATSAAVTLGATLVPPADISLSMSFYRATIAWVGGLTTLMLAVYILGPYQVGGIPDANLRQVQHARTEDDPRFLQTLRAIGLPYLALTLLCAALLIMLRVSADDALIVAMSMLATNSFMPHQTGTTVLGNPAAELVMIVFMVLGATSIVWHRLVLSRNATPSRDRDEGRLYLGALGVLVLAAIIVSLISPATDGPGFDTALTHVFDVVSVATTTGITHDRATGLSIPFELVLLIVFIGGCSYSTAGGIKAFRLQAMLRHVGNELERLVFPNAMLKDDVQYDARQHALAKAVWSAFFLAVLTITIGLLLLAAQGHALPEAMALSAGAFSQVGNLVAGAAPGLMEEGGSDGTLMILMGIALIARIEILVVLAALAGDRW